MEKVRGPTVRVVAWDELATRRGLGPLVTLPSMVAPGVVVGGRYRIRKQLGMGGQARVWLADDLQERREIAFKEMLPPKQETAGDLHKAALLFRREFFAMRKLQHPNIVRVYDSGYLETGHRYITMEIAAGRDLQVMVEGHPLPTPEVLAILMQIASVLAFIHARLFVHCDIKASNIRRSDEGDVKILDFGIMHQLGTPADPSSMHCTPTYVAPECLRGGIVDGRVDLYALGVLGFFLATARLPFVGDSPAAVFEQQLHAPPPVPSSFAPVDTKLDALLLRLMEKDPRRRFANAAELLAALGEASGRRLTEEPLAARASYLQLAEVVGRDAEMSRLAKLLEATTEGQSRALFFSAPAGVGKSRVLQEFELTVRVGDLPFAMGQCRADGVAPLAPLHQALRALVPVTPPSVLRRHLSVLQRFLPNLDQADVGSPTGQEAPPEKVAVFETLSSWLRDLAGVRPFVIAFEDLHWADSATLETMNVIIRALAGTRGLVIGAFRSDEVDRLSLLFQTVDEGVTDVLELQPLSRAHLGVLVEHVLPGSGVPAPFVDNLHAATSGNAFFAMECLRALVERDALTIVDGRWRVPDDLGTLPLPRSIEEAVLARLATLAPERLTFFRHLAAIGRVVELDLLRILENVDDDQLFAALDEGIERQFLQYAQGRYFFTHDTVRSAVYDHTPPDVRRCLHGSIAEAIQAQAGDVPGQARAIGYHHARSAEPRRAIAPLLRAGAHAIANAAFVEATVVLEQAAGLLEAHPDFPDQPRLLTSTWGRLVEVGYTSNPSVCWYAKRLFDHWDATGLYEEGKALVWAEYTAACQAEGPRRKELLGRMFQEVPLERTGAPRQMFLKRAEYGVLLAVSLAIMGKVTDLEALMTRIGQEQPPGFPYREATIAAQGGVVAHTGRYASILEVQRESLSNLLRLRAEVPTLPRQLSWFITLGTYIANVCLGLMGRPLDEDLRREGLGIANELGFADMRVYHLLSQLFRASFAGDGSTFVPLLSEISDGTRRLGNPWLPQRNIAVYGPPYYLERAELDLGRAIVAKGARLSQVLPADGWLKLYVLVYGACLDVLSGTDEAQTERSLGQAIAAARDADLRMLGFTLVYAARFEAGRGNGEAAARYATRALARAVDPATANPFDEILARRVLADIEGGVAAIGHLERAADLAIENGVVLQDGIVHLALAERLRGVDAPRSRFCLARAGARLGDAKAGEWLKRVSASGG